MKTNKWKTIMFLCASITACDPAGEDPSLGAEDPDFLVEEEAFGDEAVTEDVTTNANELFAFPITVCGWECPPGYYKGGATCSWDCPGWNPGCENASVCYKIP